MPQMAREQLGSHFRQEAFHKPEDHANKHKIDKHSSLLHMTTHNPSHNKAYTYDGMGNMLTQTDFLGKTTTFTYDGRYRLATVTDPLGHVTSYGYDVKGNRTSQTDANGTVTRHEYDDQGHLVKTIDSLNQSTLYGYGSSGCSSCGGGSDRLTSLTDAKGQTTSFQYDLLGRLTSETDPLGKVTTFTYDSVGNLQTRTDANGSVVTYGYDAMKRLTGKSYPDSSSESFTYDAVGRVITAANAHLSYTYGYDTADRLTSVTDSRGYTITYQYDTLGNRTKMALQPGTADEHIFTYSYDAAGRPTAIGASSGIFTYGYDALGRRTSLAYPNGITAVYGYDDAGRLTSLSHRTAGTTIASFTYSHDNVGNRTSKAAAALEQYLYDSIYRLLTVTAPKPETFNYDAVGNRQAGPGAKDTGYLHDAANRMTKGRKLTYGYDNNGNQTEKTVPSAATGWSQSWDFENRLIKVEKGTATDKRTVTFTYDPQGRRIEKKVAILANGSTSTETYAYVYDGDNILLEIQTSPGGATEKTVYTHGAGVDEHLSLERNGSSYFYHADGLGSIVSITDRNRAVVQSYEYDSYGMQKPATTFRNSYTYTGREWDRETGLYYYRARYSDPMEGRFISKDPIGFKGGVNVYAYVQSNPISYKDPFGLDTWSGAGDSVGGFFLFGGITTTYGWLHNWRTGEKCYVEIKAYRLGFGLGGGVTASSLWVFNGPATGAELSGVSVSAGLEGGLGAYLSGGPGGSLGVNSSSNVSASVGAGIGAGIMGFAEYGKTKVIKCEKGCNQ